MNTTIDATIAAARTASDFLEARRLFEEYASAIGIDLSFQNFPDELRTLSSMYAPPQGCLLLARRGGGAVACVGVRPLKQDSCEMKRLYVQPAARGSGLGRQLAQGIIEAARERGYRRMFLDTLSSMEPARRLYRSLGFQETAPYYENPIEDVVYMELDLVDASV